MFDTDSDDETEGAIDLSIPNPGMQTLKPYSLELLGSPKSPHVAETGPILGTSLDPDNQQQGKVISPHSKTKSIILVPKKRPYVWPPVTQGEQQVNANTSTPVVAATKLPKPLTSTSKASTSKSLSSKASTPEAPTSKLTPLVSTSKASTSKASTSQASTSKTSTSKASTSQDSTSKASTSKASTSLASTSKSSKSKASTSQASTSKASTSQASTSKSSKSKASTSQASTSKASSSQASTSKASTSKASSSQASTSKALKSKASPSQASTSKASTSKASTSQASTSKASTSKASPSKPSTSRELRALKYIKLGVKRRKQVELRNMSKRKACESIFEDSGIDDESSFWLRTVRTKFGSNEFRENLRESNFSERQAKSLQNALQLVTQKLNNANNNSDRMVKTHKCNICEFTISHQCACIFFLQIPIPITNPPEVIPAEKTVICICNFAFFHTHNVDWSRVEAVNIASVKPEQQPPRRKSNIATIHCSACDMIVRIEHPPERKVKNTLIQWNAVESENEKEFHASITKHLQRLSVAPLTLGEMFMCTKTCCLLFHRCGD